MNKFIRLICDQFTKYFYSTTNLTFKNKVAEFFQTELGTTPKFISTAGKGYHKDYTNIYWFYPVTLQ